MALYIPSPMTSILSSSTISATAATAASWTSAACNSSFAAQLGPVMRRIAAFTVVALAVVGCGHKSDLGQVTGTVKNADGSPLRFEAGPVIFQAAEGNSHATGAVQPDGSFTMMTKKPGDGVKPGHYKVVIQLWKSYKDFIPAVP